MSKPLKIKKYVCKVLKIEFVVFFGNNFSSYAQSKRMDRIKAILEKFSTPEDVYRREVKVGECRCVLLFKGTITDALYIGELVRTLEHVTERHITLEKLIKNHVFIPESDIVDDDIDNAVQVILSGNVIVVLDGVEKMLSINAKSFSARAVSEPPTSTVTFGPREGFVEEMKTNLNLLQRRIKSPHLAIEKMSIGRISNTQVSVIYLSNVAEPKIVKRIKERLSKIDIDVVIDANTLLPYLEEKPLSIFMQAGLSEKPDIIQAKISEGRVAIMVDGSPLVITLPFILIEDFQNSEDYYSRSSISAFLRFIRIMALTFGLLLPGLYVAMQNYHFNALPLKFMVTVMTSVNGIPFVPLTEILFVLLLFDIIRESSVRMPRAVGMAMSIVGGLVLGDTAVKAGIISSPAVMIMALSSIAIYTVPNQVNSLGLLRMLFVLLGGLGGLYFIAIGHIILIAYLSNINSYGTPYLSPISPLMVGDLKDTVFMETKLKMGKRPRSIPNINPTRHGENS